MFGGAFLLVRFAAVFPPCGRVVMFDVVSFAGAFLLVRFACFAGAFLAASVTASISTSCETGKPTTRAMTIRINSVGLIGLMPFCASSAFNTLAVALYRSVKSSGTLSKFADMLQCYTMQIRVSTPCNTMIQTN